MACATATAIPNSSLLASKQPSELQKHFNHNSTFSLISARRTLRVRAEAMSTTIEKLGVKIQRNPPESKLTELGVRKWPK